MSISQIQKLIKKSKNPDFIREVFEFAKEKYGDSKRISGEYYINHALNVAVILSDMNLDQTTVAAGLLHDIEGTSSLSSVKNITETELSKKFGPEITGIVEKTSELKKIYYSFHAGIKDTVFTKEKSENLRKMFFAIAKDLRVILIDLASRIDGLQSINNLSLESQKLYATETLEIFVPIANRLGLGEIKAKLEDLAFEILFPKEFHWLKEHISQQYKQRQEYLITFIPRFKKMLRQEKIGFLDIGYRAKSYWSTYQKLKRHNMDFEKIYDLVALRLVVKDITACYQILGTIHKHYQPISGQIQDYIAKPKENGYKSLHTTVFLEPGRFSEIQIKTAQMHQEAEHGICAHWAYKEKINLQKDKEQFQWAAKIPEFLETFKIDFFADQIFTFTPKGDVLALPKGSTPIDFAYALHSDVGNHCESAKINGKIIPLSEILKNGDVIEIITNKKRKPSQDWLRFVKTNFAKSHIKKLITDIPTSLFSVPNFVKKKIVEISERAKKKKEEKSRVKKELPNQIYLAGQRGMMVTIAKCCTPQSGQVIKAYLTRHRAAVVHNTSCGNLQNISQKFPEKVVDASWK